MSRGPHHATWQVVGINNGVNTAIHKRIIKELIHEFSRTSKDALGNNWNRNYSCFTPDIYLGDVIWHKNWSSWSVM